MPGTWLDVLTLDLGLDDLLKESTSSITSFISIFGTLLAFVRPTIPGDSPRVLRTLLPLVAWVVFSDEATVRRAESMEGGREGGRLPIAYPRGKTGSSGNNWHHLWQQRRAFGNAVFFSISTHVGAILHSLLMYSLAPKTHTSTLPLCQVTPNELVDDGSPESFFYVNGICTTRRMALATGAELSKMFNKNVTVVHNPTDSFVMDIFECVFAKLWTGQSFATSRPCALLMDKLLEALRDPTKTKASYVRADEQAIYSVRASALSVRLFGLSTEPWLDFFTAANFSMH